MGLLFVFFFKQNTAYEMRISDWSSDVCSSDLPLIDAALSLRRETLGPDNPATLDTANNLAGLYRKTGRAAEAEALLYHVLEEIGRASCGARVGQYVEIAVVAVSLTNN